VKKPKNNKKKNPNGGEGRKKTKRGVFIIWQMNLLAHVEFAWPRRMATEMDSVNTAR
jgi:hypothetical protein